MSRIEKHSTFGGDTQFEIEVIDPIPGKKILTVKEGTTIYALYRMLGVLPASGKKLLKTVVIEMEV